MHAAVWLFDDDDAGQVARIWDRLAEAHGLEGVRRTPVPHLSIDVFADLDRDSLEDRLATRARSGRPFDLALSGLGLFPGADAVLYLAVTPTHALLERHASLHTDLDRDVRTRSPFYAPGAWVPHVTLAHHDPEPEGLAAATRTLLEAEVPGSLRVTGLGWIEQPGAEAGRLAARWDFPDPTE